MGILNGCAKEKSDQHWFCGLKPIFGTLDYLLTYHAQLSWKQQQGVNSTDNFGPL